MDEQEMAGAAPTVAVSARNHSPLEGSRRDIARRRGPQRLLVGPYRLLRGNRPLGLVVLSHAAAMLGTWMSIISLSVVVYVISHTATSVALITLVRLVASSVFTLATGALIDRWDRTALMVGATAGSAACMVGLVTVQSTATLPLAVVLTFCASALISLIRPTVQTVLAAMVPEAELEQANALLGQMESVADIIGPLLSSLLFLFGDVQLSFLLAAFAFVVSGLAFGWARVPNPPLSSRPEDEGAAGQMVAGFRFLMHENEHVLAALTLTVASLILINGAWWSLLVLLSVQSFHLGSQGTGYLEAVYSVGGLIGGFVVGFLSRRLRLGGPLMIGTAGTAVATMLFGLSPAGLLPFVVIGVLGVVEFFVQVNAATVLQAATPSELRGRTFSAFEAVMVVAELGGALSVGPLIALLGAPHATVAIATVSLLTLLLALPLLWRLEVALGVRIFLRQVPIFAHLSRRTLDALGTRVRLEHVRDGTVIVREGEHGERLYMVKRGTVDVLAKGERPRALLVATLAPLDYFGEIALLRDVPRTASVQSRGVVDLYSLGRADFAELLAQSSELQEAVTTVGNARYADTQRKLLVRLHE